MDSKISPGFLSQLVSHKLTHDNYLLWKRQILPFIRSHGLSGHLDGGSPAPPMTITQEVTGNDGKVSCIAIPNPAYDVWFQKDQSVVAYLTATLSDRILQTISDHFTAAELWRHLAHSYSQVSESRALQLKWQFQSMRKGTKTITEFLGDIKIIIDQLAAIGYPVSDRDVVQQVLGSLGPQYRMFCTALQVASTLPCFEDLQAKLLQYEVSLTQDHLIDDPHPVMFTSGSTSFRPPAAHMGRGGLLPTPTAPPATRGTRVPTCFHCNKRGHVKADCWHNPQNRNKAGRPGPRAGQMNVRQFQGQPQGNFRAHQGTDQGQSAGLPHDVQQILMTAFNNMNLRQNDDGVWYIDSGAAAHVTSDAGKLSNMVPYIGTGTIVTGDGSHHPISHTGNASLSLSQSTLPLKNVLLTPAIEKNILSVSKLVDETNSSMEFTPSSVCLKDLRTKKMLAKGERRGNMYVFEAAPGTLKTSSTVTPSFPAYLSQSSSVVQCNKPVSWHRRLGHCSQGFLDKLSS